MMSIDARTFVGLILLLAACSGSSDGGTTQAKAGDHPSGTPTPAPPGATTPPSGGADDSTNPPPPADPKSCQIAEVTGVADVTPTFAIYDPSTGSVPKPMKGGKIEGTYKVDKAVVFLPNQVKGLAKPDTSKGTINAWAVFDGTKSYRLKLHVDLSVDSIIGPQPQKQDVAAAGTFSVAAEKLKFETSCDPSQATPDAELSFDDQGARGTLVVKTHVSQGDVYIQLDAAKQ